MNLQSFKEVRKWQGVLLLNLNLCKTTAGYKDLRNKERGA